MINAGFVHQANAAFMSGTENWFSEDSASSSASIPITIPVFLLSVSQAPEKHNYRLSARRTFSALWGECRKRTSVAFLRSIHAKQGLFSKVPVLRFKLSTKCRQLEAGAAMQPRFFIFHFIDSS